MTIFGELIEFAGLDKETSDENKAIRARILKKVISYVDRCVKSFEEDEDMEDVMDKFVEAVTFISASKRKFQKNAFVYKDLSKIITLLSSMGDIKANNSINNDKYKSDKKDLNTIKCTFKGLISYYEACVGSQKEN